jgi:hypothetical protein
MTKSWVQQKGKGITEGTSGLAHRTVRCATGQCPVHQRTPSRTRHLRENPKALRYNSPDSVRCPKEERLWNSPASGICSAIIHRTVRCTPDCPVNQQSNGYLAPTVTCWRIKCAPERAEVRHARAGTLDTLQYMSGVPPDI